LKVSTDHRTGSDFEITVARNSKLMSELISAMQI